MKNPIEFRIDDVISDVTVTSFPVKYTLELVNTITRPFFIQSLPKLGMVDIIFVDTNPIKL